MMISFAARMQATAQRLLKTYGGVVTGIRTPVIGFNPATSETILDSEITYTGYGNASPYSFYEMMTANNTIANQDLKMLFSCLDTRPAVNDQITSEGTTYRVMRVDISNVNETDVVYKLQLRI